MRWITGIDLRARSIGALEMSAWLRDRSAASAQFSALVSEFSPRTHVGTALTLQMCAGFLLTMASLRLLPAVAASQGWRVLFVNLPDELSRQIRTTPGLRSQLTIAGYVEEARQ